MRGMDVMKCLNCGFESNDSFCPMCGTKLPEAFTDQPENPPHIVVIHGEDGPTAYYFDTNDNSNPYQQTNQTAPFPPQGMPTPQPYTQYPQGVPTPPPYTQYSQGVPTPPPYAPYPPQAPQPKKSGSALPAVLSIIVCAVIVIGTIINIVSSIFFKESVFDFIEDTYDSYADSIYEPIYENDTFYEDPEIYPMNEAVNFKDGTITLKSAEITKEKFQNDDSVYECAFTFDIENTSDETITFSVPTINICPEGSDYYEDCYEWLYDDYENSDEEYDLRVDAGETKSFVTYYKIPKEDKNFSIMCDLYAYQYDFMCYFEASLAQAETTVATTEPTTTKPTTTEPATKKPN